MASWPATLADLKIDLGVESGDTRNDAQYALDLAAAVAFVERACADLWNFDGTKPYLRPPIDDDGYLGTLRYAGRLSYRRRSPDGMVNMGDAGVGRIPSSDADIDRLLQIGRFSPPSFA